MTHARPPDTFARAEAYALLARQHRAYAAAALDPRTRAQHNRKAVQLEAAVRSIANVLMYRAKYGREEPSRHEVAPSDER